MYEHYRCQIPILMDLYEESFGYHDRGYFVELGAFDCRQWSNCWSLAMAGWTGVFVEPQPEYIEHCERRFGDNPKISIVEAAISIEAGVADLWLGDSLATISKRRVEEYDKSEVFGHFKIGERETVEVATMTLNKLLENEQAPQGFEVLSIDVEGSEMDVLFGFTIDYWSPQMVIVEAHEQAKEEIMNYRATFINDYFRRYGYTKIYSDNINNIYIL